MYCFVHFGCTRIQKRVRYMSSATLSLCLAAPRLLFVRREWEVASLEDQLATIHGVALEACICLLLSRRMCKIMWGAMLTAIRNHLVGEYVRKQPVQLDMSSVLLSPPIPPHDFTLVVFLFIFCLAASFFRLPRCSSQRRCRRPSDSWLHLRLRCPRNGFSDVLLCGILFNRVTHFPISLLIVHSLPGT